MSHPLSALPPPPPGKTGFPWTAAPAEPRARLKEADCPRITLVTPSFRQGQFLEETIRSALAQEYPNLEYMVIDGGSTDGTVELLRKYERHLTFWVSEPDRGQSDAINKGLARSTGVIFNWLNADDRLAPDALWHVAAAWQAASPHLLVGRGQVVDAETGALLHDWQAQPPRTAQDFIHPERIAMSQPSAFVDAKLVRELGGLRRDLHYILDWELYLRFALKLRDSFRVEAIPELLSVALRHEDAKTHRDSDLFLPEWLNVLAEVAPQLPLSQQLAFRLYIRQQRAHAQVIEGLNAPQKRARQLLTLGLAKPELLADRFYWGALKRAVRAQ
jgi:glycosyltransferase involved in cell wall biosynthesis